MRKPKKAVWAHMKIPLLAMLSFFSLQVVLDPEATGSPWARSQAPFISQLNYKTGLLIGISTSLLSRLHSTQSDLSRTQIWPSYCHNHTPSQGTQPGAREFLLLWLAYKAFFHHLTPTKLSILIPHFFLFNQNSFNPKRLLCARHYFWWKG